MNSTLTHLTTLNSRPSDQYIVDRLKIGVTKLIQEASKEELLSLKNQPETILKVPEIQLSKVTFEESDPAKLRNDLNIEIDSPRWYAIYPYTGSSIFIELVYEHPTDSSVTKNFWMNQDNKKIAWVVRSSQLNFDDNVPIEVKELANVKWFSEVLKRFEELMNEYKDEFKEFEVSIIERRLSELA